MPPTTSTMFPTTTAYPSFTTFAPNATELIEEVTDSNWEEPPVPHWCFDFMVFYRSFNDTQSKIIVQDLEDYSKFSFIANGLVTTLLAMFGLAGNILLVHQIQHTRYFSRRLACHLAMLCCWDMALLLSCLLTYGISCLYYGIIPFVGVVAYLLFIFQPFASFCTTGTIWQVLAITVERYMAVSRPLEQRTRNAQFSVRAICATVVVVAFILNMTPMIFEHELTDCYEIRSPDPNSLSRNISYNIKTMIIPKPVIYIQVYAILVHLLPDIIFRAPTPIIVIAILTVRTLQICSNRMIGMQTIHARRNVPYMLTILNIKFILCNTLYMFNTILMEVLGYGGKVSSTQTELEVRQYLQSLYLTDFSNMLLAIHSATNWLIFYHWPTFGKTKKYSNMTLTSSASKTQVIDTDTALSLLSKFSANKNRICTDALTELCVNAPGIAIALLGAEAGQCRTREAFVQHIRIQKGGAIMADVIEEILLAFTQKHMSTTDIGELCRDIGYKYYMVHTHIGASQYRFIRQKLAELISQSNYPKTYKSNKVYHSNSANTQETEKNAFQRIFNFALREMKAGVTSAEVDVTRAQKPGSRHGTHPKEAKNTFTQHRSIDCEIPESRRQYGGMGATVRFVHPNGVVLPRAMSLDLTLAPRDYRLSLATTATTSNSVNVVACGDDSADATDDSFVDVDHPRDNGDAQHFHL
uniref:G_PROTEIN_RECEP_F1_2 domain-containing protein n=1 Tax=Panagrellus redivivus TaxID=6233 RepID=A0A7E4VHC9_PANRE